MKVVKIMELYKNFGDDMCKLHIKVGCQALDGQYHTNYAILHVQYKWVENRIPKYCKPGIL